MSISRVAFCALLVYMIVGLTPIFAHATQMEADAMCTEPGMCQYGTRCGENGPPGVLNKPCFDHTNGGTVNGICIAQKKCLGQSASGLGGKGNALDAGLQQLGQLLGPLMQKLLGGGGSGSGSGGGSGGGAPIAPTPGCTQQQTSDFNIYASNPSCYYYVAPVSGTLGESGVGTSVSDRLLNALGASTDSASANANTNTNTNTNTSVGEILSTVTGGAQSTTTLATSSAGVIQSTTLIVPTGAANLLPGVRGDIQVMGSGATILAGQRDTTSNTEVAGFFGSNTFNGQSTGIVASLCQSRPWASGLFSKLIPPSFFDSLCSLRGYQVGTPQPVVKTQVRVTQTAPKPVATTTASAAPTVPAKVAIWAVPAKVSLGSRTSIFWNTQGVTSCTETAPDGSFSQSSLSGGASTVPITTATTFTISCLAPDGSHVTDYVTVNLAI